MITEAAVIVESLMNCTDLILQSAKSAELEIINMNVIKKPLTYKYSVTYKAYGQGAYSYAGQVTVLSMLDYAEDGDYESVIEKIRKTIEAKLGRNASYSITGIKKEGGES